VVGNLVVILGDQLSLEISSLEKIKKNEDKILMMEVSNEIEYVNHHKKKLVLILSAMRHFADELKKNGFNVTYIEFDKSKKNFTKELEYQCTKCNPKSIKITHPSEYRVLEEVKKWEKLLDIPVTILEDTRFFCKIDEFSEWAESRKELKMENFYQQMRKKYKILIDNKVNPEKIFFELFKNKVSEKISSNNDEGQIEIIYDNCSNKINFKSSEILLDSILNNNIDVPYSCQGGVCSSCIARIKKGKIDMKTNQILTNQEINEGLILTCQSIPKSKNIIIDFDDV